MIILTSKNIKNFWKHVDKSSGDNACWIWTGAKYKHGHGCFSLAGKNLTASRASYIIHFGPILNGLLVCHNCPNGDNPSCVNPTHLFLGTQKENMANAKGKNRLIHVTGEAHGKAKLTLSDVSIIRQRYAKGDISMGKLAKEYNVSAMAVYCVIRYITWKERTQ